MFDNYHEVFPWTLDFIHGEVRLLSILIVFFVKTTQTLKPFIGTKKKKKPLPEIPSLVLHQP